MTGGLSYMQARRCLRQSFSSCQLFNIRPVFEEEVEQAGLTVPLARYAIQAYPRSLC